MVFARRGSAQRQGDGQWLKIDGSHNLQSPPARVSSYYTIFRPVHFPLDALSVSDRIVVVGKDNLDILR